MFKKTKLIAGIALMVQSVTCVVLFFANLGKKKKMANTFLGVGLLSAIFGALMLIWEVESENLSLLSDDWEDEDLFHDDSSDDVDCVISDDDTADILTLDEEEA